MLQNIKLGGAERPLLFGQTVYKIYKRETGKNFADLLKGMEEGDTSALPDLVYWALRTGELALKMPPGDYDEIQVSLWLDEDKAAFEKCMEAFFDSILVTKDVRESQARRITGGNGEPETTEKKMSLAKGDIGT